MRRLFEWLGDWRATIEARFNRGLQAALARDRAGRAVYVPWVSDAEALASDWRAVGDDIRVAIDRWKAEHPT